MARESGLTGRLPNPHPAASSAPPPPGPRFARAGLRSHRPPPTSSAPPAHPGPRTSRPAPPLAALRPPAFPARPALTFTCTFCTRGGSSGEKHLPGTATSPAPAPPGFLLPLQGRKVDGVRVCVREKEKEGAGAGAAGGRAGGRRARPPPPSGRRCRELGNSGSRPAPAPARSPPPAARRRPRAGAARAPASPYLVKVPRSHARLRNLARRVCASAPRSRPPCVCAGGEGARVCARVCASVCVVC